MRIKELRQAAGLTQADLARRVGVNKCAVCRWDSGKAMPRADKLPQLAAVLGCTVAALYGPEEGRPVS